MRKQFLLFFFCFMIASALLSCKKETPETPSTNNPDAGLANNTILQEDLYGTWTLETVAVDGDFIDDFTPTELTFFEDLSYTFVFTFETYESTEEGTWTWDGTTDLVSFLSDPQFPEQQQLVVSVDATELILERENNDGYGNISLSRFTYSR